MAAVLEVRDEVARALEGDDLLDQLDIALLLGVADRVAEALLRVVVGQGGDELVAAHADVPMDAPDREHDLVRPESAVPRDRMVVVRVDERAVDVEDRGGHAWLLRQRRGLALVAALADLFDELVAERRQVVRVAARGRPSSTRTSSSTHSPPALRMSVRTDG